MLLLHVTEGSDDGQQFLSVRKFLIFDYFWLHWVLVAVHGFSLAAVSGGLLSRCGVQASDCSGFCCRARALEHWLRSCGAWTWLPCGMWNLPGPGIEPTEKPCILYF